MQQTVSERFWSKVDIAHPDVCWEWKCSLNPGGYPQFKYPGRKGMTKGHRVAALLAGKITDLKATKDTFVLHTCHNRKCVNPNHLYVGTQKDNMRDMTTSGRNNHLLGENSHLARYSDHQINEVFRFRELRWSQQRIADETGISLGHVNAILNHRTRQQQYKAVDNSPVRPHRHNSKHPEWLKAAVLDMFAAGHNPSSIARQLGVNKSFVFSLIKREVD